MTRPETQWQALFTSKQQQHSKPARRSKDTSSHFFALICTVSGNYHPTSYFWIFFNEINNLRRFCEQNLMPKNVINEALRRSCKSGLSRVLDIKKAAQKDCFFVA
jgi:hypothetical protein